jgi:hypothetical protein
MAVNCNIKEENNGDQEPSDYKETFRFDSITCDPNLKNGFTNLRMIDINDVVRKQWFTIWDTTILMKSFSERDKKDKQIIDIDSTFNMKNKLLHVKKEFGDKGEKEQIEFDSKSDTTMRRFCLIISDSFSNEFICYEKLLKDSTWSYFTYDYFARERSKITVNDYLKAEIKLKQKIQNVHYNPSKN